MAHPLLRQINKTGASITAAKFKPAWKSPCETKYLVLEYINYDKNKKQWQLFVSFVIYKIIVPVCFPLFTN